MAESTPPAITRYWLDIVLVGGASMALGIPLFFISPSSPWFFGRELELVNILINFPHFMASYLLLYASWKRIKRHHFAALWVPLGLVAWAAVGLSFADTTPALIMGMMALAGVYTAWHYAGQTWGMMATFAHLQKHPFDMRERKLVRAGLMLLTTWHATHWLSYFRWDWAPSWTAALFKTIQPAFIVPGLLGAALGIAGMVLHKRRTGSWPDVRALVAFAALLFWYALMARWPIAIFWAQASHAVQYLAFPGRVIVNASRRKGRPVILWAVLVGVGLIMAGYITLRMLPDQLIFISHAVGGSISSRDAMPVVVTIFLNIHHYFTDGAIWKIRNPEVTQDLFAHVRPGGARGNDE